MAIFMGFASQTGAGSNNSHVQLLNPSDSTVLDKISKIVANMNTGPTIYSMYDTALATEVTTVARIDSQATKTRRAQIRRANNTSILGSQFWSQPNTRRVVTNLNDAFITLEPGQGFLVTSNTKNEVVTASFIWSEV